jgi:aminoglycoside phosphotransferase (APT) family kinase protein
MSGSPLIDEPALARWLDGQGLAPGAPMTVAPLGGGRSNAMFRVHRGDDRWVLRRPAAVAIPRAGDGMRREHRILRALGPTPVPVPEAVALCEDESVLGCVFHLMGEVAGFAPSTPIPAPFAADDDTRRALTFAMVDAVALLHAVDWEGVGLGDFGRPADFHERQVARWQRQFESYQGRPVPGLAQVGAWLTGHRPARWTPAIMHGDYHMLNVLVAPELPPRVAAIVDWETATIGDPLLDIVGFCEQWCPSHVEGWPARDELLDRYRAVRGVDDVGDLRYYVALYHYRLGILLEGIYQRSSADDTRETDVAMGHQALREVELAVAATEG